MGWRCRQWPCWLPVKGPGLRDVPWITQDGLLDPTRFPIDSVLKQTLSERAKSSEAA